MSTKMARVKEVPKGELIRIKYDAYEVWPDHCAVVPQNYCLQCIIEGKIRCSPRFWEELDERRWRSDKR